MKSLIVIVLAGFAGALGAAAVVVSPRSPSPQLLKDIEEVHSQVAAAEKDAALYGGLVGSENQLRLATLRATEAMLQQRRLSWFHGINLTFPNVRTGLIASQDEVVRIEGEIKKAEASAATADASAAQYSGGLVLSMILVRAATERATVAQLRQQLAYSRAGEPVQGTGPDLEKTVSPPSPGKTTTDKDAL